MLREAQIDSLANFLVAGLIARGAIKAKCAAKDIVALVIELMSANFEVEAEIDEEADRLAEELSRKDPRADLNRLRSLARQKIAQKKGFVL